MVLYKITCVSKAEDPRQPNKRNVRFECRILKTCSREYSMVLAHSETHDIILLTKQRKMRGIM